MRKASLILLTILLLAMSVQAQRNSPPTESELAEITARGRALAEYDVAAWHSTDAVFALKPEEGSFTRYIAQKSSNGWTVMYGRFNEKRDKFLITYEANQGATPKEFTVKKYDQPKEDTGFYFSAAKAIETALADFRGEKRPYNVAVLPTKLNQMYVYVVPAQTKIGIYPLGGDARYLISQDGTKIVEKRQLHKSILEFSAPPNGEEVTRYHVAVLDDIPEDTDVFHVLARSPAVPELVASQKYVYSIKTDGTILYLMTMEAFRKIGSK